LSFLVLLVTVLHSSRSFDVSEEIAFPNKAPLGLLFFQYPFRVLEKSSAFCDPKIVLASGLIVQKPKFPIFTSLLESTIV
jgi:hypothetical protein